MGPLHINIYVVSWCIIFCIPKISLESGGSWRTQPISGIPYAPLLATPLHNCTLVGITNLCHLISKLSLTVLFTYLRVWLAYCSHVHILKNELIWSFKSDSDYVNWLAICKVMSNWLKNIWIQNWLVKESYSIMKEVNKWSWTA